jgi:hypothetical protein
MRIVALFALSYIALVLASAHAPKPCEVLKAEITKKLEAHGVNGYTLEIVAKNKDAVGKVMGSCENGTKKIIYSKTSTPTETPGPVPSNY